MEDYSGLYLDDETARRQKAMAMARALRGQQETANFDSLAGFDDLAKQGFSNVASGQQALEGAARAGAQRQLQMALAKQSEDARAREGALNRAADAARLRAELGARDRKAEGDAKDKGREIGEGLRKEYLGNSAIKDAMGLGAQYRVMRSAYENPSPAGDITMVYGFMKMQDPGSTIRENEYATAENSGGVAANVRNTYNKMLKGERLPQSVRDDFMKQAGNALKSRVSAIEPLGNSYRKLAEKSGLDPSDVVVDIGLSGLFGQEAGATASRVHDARNALGAKQVPAGNIDMSGGDTVDVINPVTGKATPVHKSKVPEALAAGGKLASDG